MRENYARKIPILLVMLVFGLIFVGCENSPTSQEGNTYYRSGTRGLEMRFLPDMPPRTIYEGDILSIGLELFNRGTSPINYGQLFITGYDPELIKNTGGKYSTGNLPVYGGAEIFEIPTHKDQYNEEGGYQLFEYYSNEISFRNHDGLDVYKVPLTIYACYEYETVASGSICIDPQPHRTGFDKPCVTTGTSMGGSQGAPVAVNYLDVTNLRDSVRLVFSISNVGGGTLLDLEVLNGLCPTNMQPSHFNKVVLNQVKLGEMDITNSCDLSGVITLYNGNGRIVCNAPITGTTAYTSPVEISLSYAYRDYIKKDIQIKGVY